MITRIEINGYKSFRNFKMDFTPFTVIAGINDEANRQFLIRLKNKEGENFSSRVLSEGTLRLLALIIIQFDNKHKGLLCFEEPENGIHPKRIKQMSELLFNLSADYDNKV